MSSEISTLLQSIRSNSLQILALSLISTYQLHLRLPRPVSGPVSTGDRKSCPKNVMLFPDLGLPDGKSGMQRAETKLGYSRQHLGCSPGAEGHLPHLGPQGCSHGDPQGSGKVLIPQPSRQRLPTTGSSGCAGPDRWHSVTLRQEPA